MFLRVLICALVIPNIGHAQCYADYKASRADDGLRLHYGVMRVPDNVCDDTSAATPIVAKKVAADGWQLLRVLSVFDASGLEKRRGDAGGFFLRY